MRRALLFLLLLTGGAQTAPSGGSASELSGASVHLRREPGLSPGVQAALRGLGSRVQVGVLVVSLDRHVALEASQPDRPFIPASTMKIVTAAGVLADRGGAGGWWSAELTVPAAQVGSARVSAVTLRGSGDPALSASSGSYSLRTLARRAFMRGLRVVETVRVDDLGFDASSWAGLELGVPMTALRLAEWHDMPPATALEARARLGVALIAELRRAGVQVRSARVERAQPQRPFVPPARQDDRGRALPPDPAVPVARRPEQGIASVRSASPFTVLAATLRPSDNLRAEELLATLAHRPGSGGTRQGALAQERAWLRRIGTDLSSVTLTDGSGLSRDDRLSARVMIDALRVLYDLPYPLAGRVGLPGALYRARGNAFVEALPQAGTGGVTPDHGGRGGTLAGRMSGQGLDVRAKTGTLPGVSSLAGYVTGRSGETLAFAILMNGPQDTSTPTLRDAQDRAVRAISQAH